MKKILKALFFFFLSFVNFAFCMEDEHAQDGQMAQVEQVFGCVEEAMKSPKIEDRVTPPEGLSGDPSLVDQIASLDITGPEFSSLDPLEAQMLEIIEQKYNEIKEELVTFNREILGSYSKISSAKDFESVQTKERLFIEPLKLKILSYLKDFKERFKEAYYHDLVISRSIPEKPGFWETRFEKIMELAKDKLLRTIQVFCKENILSYRKEFGGLKDSFFKIESNLKMKRKVLEKNFSRKVVVFEENLILKLKEFNDFKKINKPKTVLEEDLIFNRLLSDLLISFHDFIYKDLYKALDDLKNESIHACSELELHYDFLEDIDPDFLMACKQKIACEKDLIEAEILRIKQVVQDLIDKKFGGYFD